MTFGRRMIRATFWVGLAGLCTAGCGGEFGESVSVPQSKQHHVDRELEGGPLALPSDEAFLIADAQRHSTGSGQAASQAHGDGTAECSASVASAGSAWAEFQLGHVLHNDASQPIEAAVLFDVEYEITRTKVESLNRKPATVALKVFVSDSDKVTHSRVMLANQIDRFGPDRQAGRESPSVNLTMQPGTAYHLVLAGRVEAAGEEGDSPIEVAIHIKRFQVEVRRQSAGD